jgi:hypothetical protein
MHDITPQRVEEIIGLAPRPALRNLLITDAYHRLALSLGELFGGEDLCWPVFATWASKQAGVFIRKDEVPKVLRSTLTQPGEAPKGLRRLASRLPQGDVLLLETGQAIVDGIARFIMLGNEIVFAELGDAFADFIRTFSDPAARTEDNLARFIERFATGPSMPDTVHVFDEGSMVRSNSGGQSLIRDAMGHYFAALHERDPNARAELILLANVECGLHEQIRLQPYILGALDAPVEELLRLAYDFRPDRAHPLADELAALVRRLSTELLMTLPVPGQTLHLGTDLPASPGKALWPRELEHLEHPGLLRLARQVGAYETREAQLDLHDRIEDWFESLLAKLDLAEREVQGTGADDWATLGDRMRYIFELFRSRQREPSLLIPPFSDEQVGEMLDGRVPTGPL